ncbi:alpha/beta fold hydrolase [Clostridium frigoris]|uniref:alpha/beta fold hydrolase n=1 Tax=Clostridium frigoris TaxID=205327 RepID=UPI001FE7EAEF|nr:alpha/beta hydrolase [Clostridium frigoris]
MIFKEFGNKNMPVIIFLHGGGLSWWSWNPQIEFLQNDYCIVTPIIDGHGEISLIYPEKYLDLLQQLFSNNIRE